MLFQLILNSSPIICATWAKASSEAKTGSALFRGRLHSYRVLQSTSVKVFHYLSGPHLSVCTWHHFTNNKLLEWILICQQI